VIRVLIAEDQAMVRGALASLIGMEPDIEVVAQVSRGDKVVAAARQAKPDVALLDIEMPGQTGLDAAEELSRELPGIAILILTTFGRPGYLRRAMESGAAGFLLKDAPADQLASAIRRAVARRARGRPRPGGRGPQPGGEPADTPRARGARGLTSLRDRGGARQRPVPVTRDGPQPPLLGYAEARRAQPGGGRARGGGAGVAVTGRRRESRL